MLGLFAGKGKGVFLPGTPVFAFNEKARNHYNFSPLQLNGL
jgi:hypothetical protein